MMGVGRALQVKWDCEMWRLLLCCEEIDRFFSRMFLKNINSASACSVFGWAVKRRLAGVCVCVRRVSFWRGGC